MFSHLACLPYVHRTSAPPCAHAAIARTDWHHHTLPVPRPKVRLWRPVLLRAYASRPRRPYPNMRRTTRARLSRTKVYFVYASQGSLNYLRHSARAAYFSLSLYSIRKGCRQRDWLNHLPAWSEGGWVLPEHARNSNGVPLPSLPGLLSLLDLVLLPASLGLGLLGQWGQPWRRDSRAADSLRLPVPPLRRPPPLATSNSCRRSGGLVEEQSHERVHLREVEGGR